MPEPARQPEPGGSVADVVPGNGRNPDGTFAVGNHMAPRGPDKAAVVIGINAYQMAAEQERGKGKSKQLVKAAGMLDAVEGVQLILRRKKVPKIFLETLELIREVIDDDSASGAQARQTLFILSGDYHDQRQVHVHQEAPPPPAQEPPPVPREPLRDENGNVFEAVEPME